MQNEYRSQYINRASILKLLSDEEIARVSHAETTAGLAEGDEYLDLGDLDQGVRLASGKSTAMRRILPRKAVLDATWSKILAQLASSRVAKPEPSAR